MTQTKVARIMMMMTRVMGMTMAEEMRRNLAPGAEEAVRGGHGVSEVKQPREKERKEHLQMGGTKEGVVPRGRPKEAGGKLVGRSRGMVRGVEAKGV